MAAEKKHAAAEAAVGCLDALGAGCVSGVTGCPTETAVHLLALLFGDEIHRAASPIIHVTPGR